jgi:hypothetical protein
MYAKGATEVGGELRDKIAKIAITARIAKKVNGETSHPLIENRDEWGTRRVMRKKARFRALTAEGTSTPPRAKPARVGDPGAVPHDTSHSRGRLWHTTFPTAEVHWEPIP